MMLIDLCFAFDRITSRPELNNLLPPHSTLLRAGSGGMPISVWPEATGSYRPMPIWKPIFG